MRRLQLAVLVAFGLATCVGCAEESGAPGASCIDKDGDGFDGASDACPNGRDCDDDDNGIHPRAAEICGNDIDENCSGEDRSCESTCDDEDRDGYGDGSGCRGPDCDDNDPAVHAGAREVCDNNTDDDCDGDVDEGCGAKCVDEDGDGYGAGDSRGGCSNDERDCDDTDEAIHPDADEVCDGVDNDCDETVDECDVNEAASCTDVGDGERECRLSVGDPCDDASLCPEETNCDPNSGQCRKISGQSCDTGECLEALTCARGRCRGDFCAETVCPENKPRCDDMRSKCVECRYWTETRDSNCEAMESCVGRGWCGYRTSLSSPDSVDGYENVTEALLTLSIRLADCWEEKNGDGVPVDMCVGVEIASELSTITESDVRDAYEAYKQAYENDDLEHMTDEQYNQLSDLLGDGLTDLDNLAWNHDIDNGPEQTCIWFDAHGTFSREKLHVQQCADFDLPDE